MFFINHNTEESYSLQAQTCDEYVWISRFGTRITPQNNITETGITFSCRNLFVLTAICQQYSPRNEAFGTIICISTSSAQQTNFVGTGNTPITYFIPDGSMWLVITFRANSTPINMHKHYTLSSSVISTSEKNKKLSYCRDSMHWRSIFYEIKIYSYLHGWKPICICTELSCDMT